MPASPDLIRISPRTARAPRPVASKASGPAVTSGSPARPARTSDHLLFEFYSTAFATLGPQHWWPASSAGGPFEVIVGAILTQSTAWTNVERAIANLRRERMLTPRAIESVSTPKLARLIRPSGYFRQKAKKLKTFVRFLRRDFGGSLTRMFRIPAAELRARLLRIHGIGPETADSILLYAGNHPVFVVDAYTRRILLRHELIHEKAGYEEIRLLFENNLPRNPQLWNEYHALLVKIGKNWCRPGTPRCSECPLEPFLPEDVGHPDASGRPVQSAQSAGWKTGQVSRNVKSE